MNKSSTIHRGEDLIKGEALREVRFWEEAFNFFPKSLKRGGDSRHISIQ